LMFAITVTAVTVVASHHTHELHPPYPIGFGCRGLTITGEAKGKFMFWHKSMGLLLLFGTAGRIGVRIAEMMRNRIPPHIPGPMPIVWAGHAAHAALYFFMVAMPVSVSGGVLE
jgi:cytochrome b561